MYIFYHFFISKTRVSSYLGTKPTRTICNVTDRKRHTAFPHGWHIVMHRLRDNVHVAVFRSVLQGN